MGFINLFKIDISARRIYGLDILRALAILTVLIGHGSYYLPQGIQQVSNLFIFDGVSLFFVLSGFLIGTILIKNLQKEKAGLKSLWNFWTRRWLRTLPAYYVVLIFLTLYSFFFSDTYSRIDVVSYFLFMQNLIHPQLLFFAESWSLAVEEWFYILVPLLLFIGVGLFGLKNKTAIITLALTLMVIVPLIRYYRFLHFHDHATVWEWGLSFYFPVVTRLDSLMYGVLGAFISFYYPAWWLRNKNILFAAGIGLFLVEKFVVSGYPVVNYASLYTCVFSFNLISLSHLLVLPFMSSVKTGKGIIFKTVTGISLISYSMYLINLSIVKVGLIDIILMKRLNYFNLTLTPALQVAVNYIVFWTAVVSGSILLYKFVEVPFMKLRDRKKSGPAKEAAGF